MGTDRPARESGLALLGTLVLLLAVTLLAHAALSLAQMEYAASVAGLEHFRARLAAEVALSEAAWAWAVGVPDSVPLWGARAGGRSVVPGASADLLFHRAQREVWLAEGRGSAGLVRAASAAPFWVLDPVARASSRRAAIEVASGATVAVQGSVSGRDYHRPPRPSPVRDCVADRVALDSLSGSPGRPPVSHRPLADFSRIGMLPLDTVMARLPRRVSGRGSPRPTSVGRRCTASPWNWGRAGDPGHACAGRAIAASVSGPLLAESGEGQGLLVVDGDLTLRDIDFSGLLHATGVVSLLGTTQVRGGVSAAQGIRVDVGASVTASACWVAWALDRNGLRNPYRVTDAPGWPIG